MKQLNQIVELKEFFCSKGLVVDISQGWYLRCYGDRWTLADGVFYLNNIPQSEKDILKYIQNPPERRKFTIKMIRSSNHVFEEKEE